VVVSQAFPKGVDLISGGLGEVCDVQMLRCLDLQYPPPEAAILLFCGVGVCQAFD
jgi:hypothetical protein